MSTYFNESVARRASLESDELSMALAAGRWWAIMEVSNPISEEPAYGDPASWQWCGAVEEWETTVVAVTEKVKERNHTSSPGCTTKGAPVPTRFRQGAPVLVSSAQVPGHEESIGQRRQKLKIPEPLRGELLQKKPYPCYLQGAPVPDRSTKGAPVSTRSQQAEPVLVSSAQVPGHMEESIGQRRQKLKIAEPLRGELLQKKPYPCYLQGAPVPDRSTKEAPVSTRSQQGEPVLVSSGQVPGHMEESIGQRRQKLKIAEPLRGELLQKKPYPCYLQGAPVPDRSTKGAPVSTRSQQAEPVLVSSAQVPGHMEESIGQRRQKLKIAEPLRGELLQKKPYPCYLQGAPVPDRSTKEAPVSTRSQQGEPVLVSSGQVPGHMEESIGQRRQKLKIAEPLRGELLQKKPYASFIQGARKKLNISKPLRQPNSTPMGAPVHFRTPQEAAVPARSSQAMAVPAESAAFPTRKILRGRRRLENLRENLLILIKNTV